MGRLVLPVEPLRADSFAPFGEVIEAGDRSVPFAINQGYAQRYHALAKVDVGAQGGWPLISLFRAQPRRLPLQLSLLERHPLGSQAFLPMHALPWLVVVAPPAPVPDLALARCFLAAPGQGVNYAAGVWHHPLLALESECDFWVVDRGGEGTNCDEHPLSHPPVWVEGPPPTSADRR